MPQLNPVWANKIEILTDVSSATPPVETWSELCAGIESMSFANNEQNQQYFFLCGNGFAHNEVTGAAPALTVSGRRVKGDAAQDYIEGLQFSLGTDRACKVKVTTAEGKVISCDCTIGEVAVFGGNTLDTNTFNCVIYFNGAPTVTNAA